MAQCHTLSQHVLAVFANGCQCFCYNPTVARLLLFLLLLLLLNLAGLEKPGAESNSCESLRSFAVPVPHLKALLKQINCS